MAPMRSGFDFSTKAVFKPMLVYYQFTGDPLHSRAACTQPCNVNTHSRANCSPGARLCKQWGHGCVNNGARLCASARLCRGSPVQLDPSQQTSSQFQSRVNSLGPSDAIWRWRSWSTLVQVMACCLRAPCHYLNQYWLISRVLWHSSEDIIISGFEDTNQ